MVHRIITICHTEKLYFECDIYSRHTIYIYLFIPNAIGDKCKSLTVRAVERKEAGHQCTQIHAIISGLWGWSAGEASTGGSWKHFCAQAKYFY